MIPAGDGLNKGSDDRFYGLVASDSSSHNVEKCIKNKNKKNSRNVPKKERFYSPTIFYQYFT